jgi:phytoene desaturase
MVDAQDLDYATMKVAVIGGGIAGLATATLLSRQGHKVEIFEKNSKTGGRAGVFEAEGFKFDAGPSWYLMPEVFENYFESIDEKVEDHYKLNKLTPAYKVFFDYREPITITGDLDVDAQTFEAIESGAGDKLKQYVDSAEKTYKISVGEFLYNPKLSFSALAKPHLLSSALPLLGLVSQSVDKYISKRFSALELKQILEYPMVFLGASPFKAPAIYHLMSYLDFKQGVYYPSDGITSVIETVDKLAQKNKVKINVNSDVSEIIIKDGEARGVKVDGSIKDFDIVISAADLHFTENKLIKSQSNRTYSQKYWQKKTQGPSALLLYLGVKGKLPKLEHHNLIFVKDWQKNFENIFENKKWPENPSIYICKPSQTDPKVAPSDHENIFVLVPLPANTPSPKDLKLYEDKIIDWIDQNCQTNIAENIVYRKSYGPEDFESDYNSWQGSALGLAHTLDQSAMFRPGVKSKNVSNLFYVGGNVQPGVGLPMCLISAELVAKLVAEENHA